MVSEEQYEIFENLHEAIVLFSDNKINFTNTVFN
jgi:hypothetical protein